MSKMDKKTLKPRIRFANFTDAWEQRKYEDIGTPSSGGTLGYDDLAVNGEYNCVLYGELYTHHDCLIKEIQNKTNCKGNTVQRNDVLFPQSTTVDALSLISPACLNVDTAETSGVFVIRPHKDIDGNFVAYYTKGNNYQRQKLSKKAQGLTIVHLYYQSIKDETIAVPTFTEQKRISTFFENLDNLITLHQRKLEKLSNVKKSLLEKMFPQKNSTTPKVRFKGFTDAWEQRKVSDVANRYDNLRIPVAAGKRESGTTPYYGANGIQDYVSGYTHDGEFILVAEDGANDLKNYPVQYVCGKIWVNNHAHVLQANIKNDNKFLKYAISNTNIEPFLVGGGRAKLNAEIMMGIEMLVPKIKQEQTRIGTFFRQLDNLITLHQRKLEKLKNVKKALLEKMFV